MNWTMKLLSGVLCIVFFSTGCGRVTNSDAPSSVNEKSAINDVSGLNWKVEDFAFTDQQGQSFGMKDLKGKMWLCDFVFTRCPNVCPPMTANMVRLQKILKKKNLVVPTVSFSVDPEHDTPVVLQNFAKKHGAEFAEWHFLTGFKQEKIKKMAEMCFKGIVEPQKNPSSKYEMLINHPSLFYLVDQTGNVVRYYDGLKPDIAEIVSDIKKYIA